MYRLVQEYVETFFAQVETETGSGLPDLVKDEFDAILECGIPLRVLFAAHPHRISPILQVILRAISTFLVKQAGLKRRDAQTGVITFIQHFGSAANLNADIA